MMSPGVNVILLSTFIFFSPQVRRPSSNFLGLGSFSISFPLFYNCIPSNLLSINRHGFSIFIFLQFFPLMNHSRLKKKKCSRLAPTSDLHRDQNSKSKLCSKYFHTWSKVLLLVIHIQATTMKLHDQTSLHNLDGHTCTIQAVHYPHGTWMGCNPYYSSTRKTGKICFPKLFTKFPWYLVPKRLMTSTQAFHSRFT